MLKIIRVCLLITTIFLFTLSARAQDVARLKNVNISESANSIELNLQSTQAVQYNIVNYMNGDVGIKLINTSLDHSLNDEKHLNIGNKTDISSAKILQDGPYSLEVRLNGNNLSNKKINVSNEIRKSNIILIENADNDPAITPLSISGDLQTLPDVKNLAFTIPDLPVFNPPKKAKPDVKMPVAMYSSRQDNTERLPDGKRVLAQAEPDPKNILDFDETTNSNASPQPGATNTTNSTTPTRLTVSPSTTPLPSNDIMTTPPPPVTTENKGFIDTAWAFIAKYFGLIIGGCIVIGIIVFVIIVVLMMVGSKGAPPQTGFEQQYSPQEQTPHQPVTDNEPVNYIPPVPPEPSQSVSDAISKIIFMKNRPGQ